MIAAITITALSWSLPAHAQVGTATLEGSIIDPAGRPVADAVVRIGGRPDSTMSDSSGKFILRVRADTPGRLRVSLMNSSTQLDFPAIPTGETQRVTVTLAARATIAVSREALATVNVTAAPVNAATLRPLLNTHTAATGGSLSYAELRSLPSDARDPLALAFTVPGAAQATGYFNTAPILSIAGQNSLYTQYYIDGFDNNEGALGGPLIELPLAAIKLLDVRTSTYDATLGRSSNGVVNEETMSGTSTVHGSLFIYDRPGASFDARQAVLPPNTSANLRRVQVGGSLGGPLGSNRTLGFAAAEYLDETQDQPIVTPYGNATGSAERRKTKLFADLDRRWNATQSTTIHAAFSDAQYIGRGGGNIAPEADLTQHRRGTMLGAEHHTVLSSNTTNTFSAQISAYHWYYPPTTSNLATPQIAILSPGLDSTRAVIGSSNYQYDSHETLFNLKNEIERKWKSHALKFGVDMTATRFQLQGAGSNFAGLYTVIDSGQINVNTRIPTVADIPANMPVYSYSIDVSPQNITASQTVVGAYAQDSWDVSRALRLTYGLRWDYDDLTSHGGSTPDLTNIQPRVSFNWQPDSQSVLRGGFGIYSGKLPYTIYSDATQFGINGSAPVTIYNSAATPLALGNAPSAASLTAARNGLPPREIRATFARGLKNPRSYQSSLGYDHAFGRSWGISVDGVYVQTIHLPRLYDLNAISREIGPADTVNRLLTFGDAFRPVLPVNGGYRQHTTTDTEGDSWYAAMFLALRHQFTEAFTADASYVLSHARNNTEDINFAASNGNNDFGKEWGDAVNDRRHKLNVRTIYTWNRRLQLSAVIDLQSGQPINRVSGLDLLGSGGSSGDGYIRNTQRYYGVPRNGERLPYALEINPGIAYRLPVARGNIELRLDAFNLLNRANYSGFPSGLASLDPRTQLGRPGDPVVYQLSGRPRQFQISARYAF